jgi:hypothetical protein
MDAYENRYARAVELIENVEPETVNRAYNYIAENGDVLNAIANDPRTTREMMVRLRHKPYADRIYNLLKSRNYMSNLLVDIQNDEPVPYVFEEPIVVAPVKKAAFNSISHQRERFLNVILKDMLTSEEPNYSNSSSMTEDGVRIEFDSPYEYYVFALDYANRIGVPAFDIIRTLAESPKYFDYFLLGEEFDELFRPYFSSLSPEDVDELIRVTDGLVESLMRRRNSFRTVRDYVYLSRRLRGYPCERVYKDDERLENDVNEDERLENDVEEDERLENDVEEDMERLENDVQYAGEDYDEDAREDYFVRELNRYNAQRLADGLEPITDESDEYEDVLDNINDGFQALIDAEMDAAVIKYAEYYDALVEEEPHGEVILM